MNATQIGLFEHQTMGAPHNGTDTSIAAAKKAGRDMGTKKAQILRLFKKLNLERGWTQAEAADLFPFARSSFCSLFNALEKEGQIRKLDGATRTSIYGGECAVYVLASSAARGGGDADGEAPADGLPEGKPSNETEGGKRIEEVSRW